MDIVGQNNQTKQPNQDASETKIKTEQHLEMPGGIEIPMTDVEMSLESAAFVIPNTNDQTFEMYSEDKYEKQNKTFEPTTRNKIEVEFRATEDQSKRYINYFICLLTFFPRFGCTKCEKNFMTRCHLKEHIIIHTGVYPFNCTTCLAGFKRK